MKDQKTRQSVQGIIQGIGGLREPFQQGLGAVGESVGAGGVEPEKGVELASQLLRSSEDIGARDRTSNAASGASVGDKQAKLSTAIVRELKAVFGDLVKLDAKGQLLGLESDERAQKIMANPELRTAFAYNQGLGSLAQEAGFSKPDTKYVDILNVFLPQGKPAKPGFSNPSGGGSGF
jgi:hypothetical protein